MQVQFSQVIHTGILYSWCILSCKDQQGGVFTHTAAKNRTLHAHEFNLS